MNIIQIIDKRFELFIQGKEIEDAVDRVALRMNTDLAEKDVLFLGILNGAFMFASDLLKRITFTCSISFLKLVSYKGTSSTGSVNRLIGLNEDIAGKTVVILEDIIDSGLTIENTMKQLKGYEPEEIKIAALLVKRENISKEVVIDYAGIEIPNDFVIGYGLDYNGYGRNLKDIYKAIYY